MIDFAIFAITFVVALIGAIVYLYPGSRRVTTVPGFDPTDAKYGNIPDITEHGSLFQFLLVLHEKFGKIASFWYNQQLVVSIYGPELFKEVSGLFDIATEMFMLFEPVITKHSMNLTNGAGARKRHRLYSKTLQSPEALKAYLKTVIEECNSSSKKLREVPKEEHVPIYETTLALSAKMIFRILFDMEKSNIDGKTLTENYVFIWNYFESSLSPSFVGDKKQMEKRTKEIHDIVRKALETRSEDGKLIVDVILKNIENKDIQLADAVTMLIGGLHTTGTTIAWALYYIMKNPKVEKKILKEVEEVLGDGETDLNKFSELKYIKNVIKETLRITKLAPWSARISNVEISLGGHTIPPNTPIIIANGLSHNSDELWEDKDTFMPERFDKPSKPFEFEPFGFAGGRKCPGHKITMVEMTMALITLLKDFKWKLVPGQDVTPKYGLVTKPETEIWATIEPREKNC